MVGAWLLAPGGLESSIARLVMVDAPDVAAANSAGVEPGCLLQPSTSAWASSIGAHKLCANRHGALLRPDELARAATALG